MRALHIAATGMAAQQMKVEVVSNNLANMSTTGYNPRRAEFADLHYQQFTRPGTITSADGTLVPTGVQLGLGVRPVSVTVMLAQGPLSQTGGDLDVAIEGRGYLEVTLPGGLAAYTRDGALKRSADGLIVTSEGHAVAPGITLPTDARAVSINTTGEVWEFTTRQVPTYIDLGGDDEEQGIRRVVNPDGNTVPVTIGDREARANQNPSVDRHVYFDVDDHFVYQGNQPDAHVTVSYYDSGSAVLSLEYDSASSAYRNGGSVALANTHTWRQYTFHVSDAYFGNRQTGGADFRLSIDTDTHFYLDTVVVHRQPGPPGPSLPGIPDGRTGVDEGATLSWTPTSGATCYHVYFGAANPPPFQATLTGLDFTPGTMDLLRTWYWRVDPVNDYDVTTGPVWHFVTRAKEDLDRDGDIDQSDFGFFQVCLSGQTIPPSDPACDWADLDDDGDVDVFDLYTFLSRQAGPGLPLGAISEQTGPIVNAGPDQQIILPAPALLAGTVADDGVPDPPGFVSVTWTLQSGPGAVAFADEHAVDTMAWFDRPGTYILRLTGSDSLVTAHDEMMVEVAPPPLPPGRAVNPSPSHESTGVQTSTGLAWGTGEGAASHNVYFGFVYPPDYRGNQAGTTFNPGPLLPGTTYYWRIDEVNEARATAGNVWTFTTGSP